MKENCNALCNAALTPSPPIPHAPLPFHDRQPCRLFLLSHPGYPLSNHSSMVPVYIDPVFSPYKDVSATSQDPGGDNG
ncbi:hypothetical protein L227DRAFT_570087 [Lentinus tigrinus ALCF2SS1-6]|uniref:Uncharacterized protein n=1 Tax=Lentinus tigrinus ALCF2SS1-6 TaxID=1328759 RepID=A0A5C2SRW2_9APHY|nr:hypothetical protein L227DRAFT_570087 [Lentinus tigrinus ALCF2SS1-6]